MVLLTQFLTRERLTTKQMENLKVERRKNKDLIELKALGGPFTSADAVEMYKKLKGKNREEKVQRFYIMVRYAKNTSLVFRKKSEIFRLKRDHGGMCTEPKDLS